MRVEFKKAGRSKNAAPVNAPDIVPPDIESSAEEMPRPASPEFWLLKLALLHEDTIGWLRAHLDPKWIQHAQVREIISLRLAAETEGRWQNVAAFLTECPTVDMRRLITEATAEDRAIPNPTQQLGDLALRLRNQSIDRQLAVLAQRGEQPETAEADRVDLLRQRETLRLLKRQPLAPLPASGEEPF
jgi:hypothetical protein